MLRLGTANLLSGRSLADGQIREADLRAAARLLDVDVLGLQEVDHDQPRSHHVDQTAVVAAELGAGWHRFAATLHGTPDGSRAWRQATDDAIPADGPSYGVALVSRLPVTHTRVLRLRAAPVSLPLPTPGAGRLMLVADEPRLAIAAVLATEHGPATVVTTHLSFVPGWNIGQLRRVARWAETLPAPRFLLGDLNLYGGLPARVTGWRPLAAAATFPAPAPRVQLDHALADGLPGEASLQAEVTELPISDHRAVTVAVAW